MPGPIIDADRDLGLIPLVDPAVRPQAGSIQQDEYDLHSPWHHHDMHQLQYAFEGSMEVEDAWGRHLLPRSLAGWIPAGTRHRNSLRRIRSVSVLLAPDKVADRSSGVRIVRVSPLMREMMAEALRWPLAAPIDAVGQVFFDAFAALCSEWVAAPAPLSLPSTTDAVLDKVLALIRADPAGCRLDQALSMAGLSERSLRRRCRSELGMGWDEYRRRARLLAAIDALDQSHRSIARIATDVGFDSQSAFARAFQRFTGYTPAAYRKQSGR